LLDESDDTGITLVSTTTEEIQMGICPKSVLLMPIVIDDFSTEIRQADLIKIRLLETVFFILLKAVGIHDEPGVDVLTKVTMTAVGAMEDAVTEVAEGVASTGTATIDGILQVVDTSLITAYEGIVATGKGVLNS